MSEQKISGEFDYIAIEGCADFALAAIGAAKHGGFGARIPTEHWPEYEQAVILPLLGAATEIGASDRMDIVVFTHECDGTMAYMIGFLQKGEAARLRAPDATSEVVEAHIPEPIMDVIDSRNAKMN